MADHMGFDGPCHCGGKSAHAPTCEFCGDTGPLVLVGRCHPTAPLRAVLDNGILTLRCYLPECDRVVARFQASVLRGFEHVRVGDHVRRMLAGSLPMDLVVTAVVDGLIYCGDWAFDQRTGGEVDDTLGWTATATGSRLELL